MRKNNKLVLQITFQVVTKFQSISYIVNNITLIRDKPYFLILHIYIHSRKTITKNIIQFMNK